MTFWEFIALPRDMRIDYVEQYGECETNDGRTTIYSLFDFFVLTKQNRDGVTYYLRAYQQWPEGYDV